MSQQHKQGNAAENSGPTELQEKQHNPEFHFANDDEKVMGIETAVYENGNTIKRIKLSNGKTAIARELTGLEMKRLEGVSGGKRDDIWPSMMHLAVKVDGQPLPIEDFDLMKAKDWSKIKFAVSDLNF